MPIEIFRGNLEHIRRQIQAKFNDFSFTELSDAPSSLAADKFVGVNSAGDALELKDAPSGGAAYVVKSGNQSINSETMVNVTDMSFSVAANMIYPFEILLLINDVIGAGVTIGLTAPTGAAWSWCISTSADRADSANINLGGATAAAAYKITGVVDTSTTSGTVQLRIRRNSAAIINPSVLADSWLNYINT